MLQSYRHFGYLCSSLILFMHLSNTSFRSSPATSGRKISFASPYGSLDFCFFKFFTQQLLSIFNLLHVFFHGFIPQSFFVNFDQFSPLKLVYFLSPGQPWLLVDLCISEICAFSSSTASLCSNRHPRNQSLWFSL